MHRLAFAVALAAGTAGCTVGPDYHPKPPSVPGNYVEPHAIKPPEGAAIDPARWWTAYRDPELTSLVERSLKGSPDIAIAASRVRQARLQEISARAQGLPTVDASADVTHIHFSKNAGFSSLAQMFSGGGGAGGGRGGGTGGGTGSGGGGSTGGGGSSGGIALPGGGITTYSVGFDASWELDVFGGVRRGVEAARARTDAAVWNQRDAAVMLAAEVADAYFSLRLDQAQAAIIKSELARQRRALEIAGHVSQVGLQPQIDVVRQRATLNTTEARLQPVIADIDVRVHAIGVLLGIAPEALEAELLKPGVDLGPAPLVPVGLPSELLRRRPDVRAAERNLAAATADIGVAVADLYPKFSLTGMAQLLSTGLGNLFSANSFQGTGSGAVSFPLLDWGTRRATVGLRKEDREQAYLTYQSTVLGALRDVEDPLAQIASEQQRNAVLKRALADSERTAQATEAQYRTGFVAQDTLLNAEVSVLDAREQLAASDTQLRQSSAALFKAIGGGWSEATGADAAARAK